MPRPLIRCQDVQRVLTRSEPEMRGSALLDPFGSGLSIVCPGRLCLVVIGEMLLDQIWTH